MSIEKERYCYYAGVGAIKYIIDILINKNNERKKQNKEAMPQFLRLSENEYVPFVVPAVTWDLKSSKGSLNNDDWYFKVGYGFRDALDLVFMVINKKRTEITYQCRRSLLEEKKDKKIKFLGFKSKSNKGPIINKHEWSLFIEYELITVVNLFFIPTVKKKPSKRKIQAWTQGPCLNFKEGDLLRSRCGTRSVQIKNASRMGWDPDKGLMHYGHVTFEEFTYQNSSCQSLGIKRLNQLDFLSMLISG